MRLWLLGCAQTVGESRPKAVCACVGTLVCQVMRAPDEVTSLTWTLLIASGSSGGGGESAAERSDVGIGSVFGGAGWAAGLRTTGFDRTSGVCFVGTRVCGRTLGVEAAKALAAAGRSSPATCLRPGVDTSARCGPAAKVTAVGGVVWLRWMNKPIQIPPSATSARVNVRSRNSPLDGITRTISAWEGPVFNLAQTRHKASRNRG